ncbi:unnamed protein product [Lathyrus sativus]|nr:unnamed protein product [Lathyrus sativus]
MARDVKEVNIANPSCVKWNPLQEGWLKCNVDVGFNNQIKTTNRGWCVRDNVGRFISAGVAWDTGIMSTVEAEALALKEAIQCAITRNMNFVIFESDSQVVVNVVLSTHVGCSEFSCIISSIKQLLPLIQNFEVKFIKCQANMVAHSLPKAANSWSRRSVINVIPPCIESLLINERS